MKVGAFTDSVIQSSDMTVHVNVATVVSCRIEFLRHIRDFLQIMFKIEQQKEDEEEHKGGEKVLMTCVGVGYTNISKTLK